MGKTKVCGGWAGGGLNGNQSVGVCRSPLVPPSLWFGEHKRPFHAVHLSVWPAGCLAGGICLSVCCWCAYAWGRSAGAPSPCGPRSVYAGAPKPALCLCVLALWFCLSVCVCVFLGAVACVSLCLCGCAIVSLSLHHPCVLLGGSICPSLCWCCALG